jgi:DNA-binding beta-propeller fold protein YncE
MKFSKSRQLWLVSSIGLLVATLLTACSLTTIDIVYVANTGSSGDGQIDTFAVDSNSGALRSVAAAVSTGGVKPVSMATTSDYANLYVANAGSSTVVHFTIGLNGQLNQKEVVTLSGAPISLAVNTAGTWLYAASCTSSSKAACTSSSATLTAYPLASGVLGTPAAPEPLALPGYAGDMIVPTGVTVLADNSAVYVTAYDQSAYNPGGSTTSTANPGWVFGFTVGSGGALTAAKNSPYEAGVKPSALAADPTDRFVYVTDYASNQMIAYTILNGSTLSFLPNGPFKTGNNPSAIVIDPRGKFIYLTNGLDSTVSAYAITLSTGTPTIATGQSGTQGNVTDTEPVSVAVDPALGRFVFTANYLGNSVSGFRLDPTAGWLTANQASPYPITGSGPTALVVIPHGNHATQSITP